MSRKSLKRWLTAMLAVGLVLVVSGCGGDDEEESTTSAPQTQTEQTEPAPTATETEPEETQPEPEPEPTEKEKPPPETSPEEAPGGAGDEEPARSLALFTGAGGRITPPVVRVPSFISIRVELRSSDGRPYALRFAGETIRVSGGLASVSTTLDGLRPGAALVGTPVGPGTRVRIEATAEPGP
ncbi:MAG TPA: hypothetical protein VES62_13565 [Thermoleophilaceae bacterium]|nr:hypothetical protein [Thermoleophilaceae bacterium]